jgi:hypothetical protein
VHIPRYCRDHPVEARCLTLYRQSRLVTTAPEPLRDQVRHINDSVDDALADLCRRHYGTATDHQLVVVITAIRQSPYGLVRPYLGQDVPEWLDEAVRVSTAAILSLADGSG